MSTESVDERLFVAALRLASDDCVRRPLWEFEPAARPLVIHERRRRFGVHDEVGDPEYR